MQTSFYDNEGNTIEAPEKGELYYGQDANIKVLCLHIQIMGTEL